MKCENLQAVREQIDRIDTEIIRLIAERGGYVGQAAAFKTSEGSVHAPARVEEVIANVRAKAEDCGANPDMVEALYREMIARFIQLEMQTFRRRIL